MNANLAFKWLQDSHYALELDAADEEAEPIFLPVEDEATNSLLTALAPVPIERIEIELTGECQRYVNL